MIIYYLIIRRHSYQINHIHDSLLPLIQTDVIDTHVLPRSRLCHVYTHRSNLLRAVEWVHCFKRDFWSITPNAPPTYTILKVLSITANADTSFSWCVGPIDLHTFLEVSSLQKSTPWNNITFIRITWVDPVTGSGGDRTLSWKHFRIFFRRIRVRCIRVHKCATKFNEWTV